MTLKAFLRHLQRTPFQPFAIVTSDGGRYEVRHPENVKVLSGGILHVYLVEDERNSVYEDVHVVSFLHITTLQPLPQKQEQAA